MKTKSAEAARGILAGEVLLAALSDRWRQLRSRGIAAIVFGLAVFHWPDVTMMTLTFLWAVYSSVDGALALWSAFVGRAGAPRLWLALVGVAGIACGAMAFAMPETVADRLILFVAAWAAVTGMMQICGAVQLRKAVEGEWILILDGAMAIVFAAALIVWPNLQIPALMWLVGWFAILLGALYLAQAQWLRNGGADR